MKPYRPPLRARIRGKLPRRLRVALHVLRGHPVAYRLEITGGATMDPGVRGALVECDIYGTGPDPGIRFTKARA